MANYPVVRYCELASTSASRGNNPNDSTCVGIREGAMDCFFHVPRTKERV